MNRCCATFGPPVRTVQVRVYTTAEGAARLRTLVGGTIAGLRVLAVEDVEEMDGVVLLPGTGTGDAPAVPVVPPGGRGAETGDDDG